MLVYIAATGLAVIALITWFHSLEVRGKRHTILVVLVVTIVAEALLAGPAAEVPVGILRPRVFGQDFRPPDAVIVAAVVVRMLHLRGRELSKVGMVWAAFIAVYLTGVLVGLLNGLPPMEVLFQGKIVFYLVGGMVVASGADLDRAYESISKLAVVLACMVPVAFAALTFKLDLSFGTPVQRFNRLGRLGNDSITLLTLVGVLTLLVEVTRARQRFIVVVAGIVLVLAPAVGRQRASYLVVAAMVVACVFLVSGRTWQRRTSATGVEMGLIGIGLVGLIFMGLAITASPGVIIEPVQDAFTGAADERSAQARVSLYDQAIAKIGDSPVIGSGVGTKVIRRAELGNREVAAAAHNIVLDIGMRIGLVGLMIYLAALWTTAAEAIRIWRSSIRNAVAAFAMGGCLIMLGVFAKAMVEPLDKFRLGLASGIGVGLVLAARAAIVSRDDASPMASPYPVRADARPRPAVAADAPRETT